MHHNCITLYRVWCRQARCWGNPDLITDMDWLTTIPLVVGVISNLSAFALEALAERLLTILLAVFIISSVSVFALTAFAWLWIKRAIGEHHASQSTARH
jgi:hypothetical protein